ncbi:MAG: A/G-specific adenine glycosylase [Gammaproteobacteria bacterium RBG_16_51_14]|nr:MAG: A/G-specific adenine glycosylase [Gammaproteobacteria bacterium RBG_16_51_14]
MRSRTDHSKWSLRLLQWHAGHGRRDLPWQQAHAPYWIWVSEIMLQQTRVRTVIPYYKRFMARFPDIVTLARSGMDDVLHHWSGLGYYARARNLHQTANMICNDYQGIFPDEMETLKSLPGIGRSTAGAILSLAFGQRHPILDGNVKRVLARYHAITGWPGRKQTEGQLWELAEKYTPASQTARYTQAIMDLGATVCTRNNPDCRECPIEVGCLARRQGRQQDFPAKKPKKTVPVRDTVFVMLENEQGEILLEQRPPGGIWGGLWCFPECTPHTDVRRWVRKHLGYRVGYFRRKPSVRHTFSHFHMDISPVHVRIQGYDNQPRQSVPCCWYRVGARKALGIPAPVQRLLGEFNE